MTSTSSPAQDGLRVLIADESEEPLERLRRILEEGLGHDVVSYAVSAREAVEIIEREDPDVAIVMVHHDDEHALTLISHTVACSTGPVIAHLRNGHADGHDREFAQRAAELGISALVPSEEPEAIQAAIEVAVRRHHERSRLSGRVEELQAALERRATIERAKGILMERHAVDERAAFAMLRDHARSHSRRVAALAAAVVEGHALLPPR
jgi:AmiR/NasT family two-component response regulator